jgi:NADPH-dependent curcumin reductase CurA
MRSKGRVLVCGSIENYNDVDPKKCKNLIIRRLFRFLFNLSLIRCKIDNATNLNVLIKELTVYGFMCYSYNEEWPKAFDEMNKLIQNVFNY